ncbi:MAG: 2'-5' RNA ligase family protein [Pseudomonadota bacterium]
MQPFIVTLQFDDQTDAMLQDLRSTHFPPKLNKVPAHLTLFHQLAETEERRVFEAIGQAATETEAFLVSLTGPMPLGRGVAIRVEADGLLKLRARLAGAFERFLIGQDRQKFRPHVTIQNKTTKARARGLLDHLTQTWKPISGVGEGLQIWRYEGGPWSPVASVLFKPSPALGQK